MWTLTYRVHGWNGNQQSPMPDARWAMQEIRRRHGAVPVVVLGHSMGGRVGLRLAADPSVVGVVVLAPWLAPEDPVLGVPPLRVRIVHGTRDRITSPAESLSYARRAAAKGLDVERIEMRGCGHGMLRRAREWQRIAVSLVLELARPAEITTG